MNENRWEDVWAEVREHDPLDEGFREVIPEGCTAFLVEVRKDGQFYWSRQIIPTEELQHPDEVYKWMLNEQCKMIQERIDYFEKNGEHLP